MNLQEGKNNHCNKYGEGHQGGRSCWRRKLGGGRGGSNWGISVSCRVGVNAGHQEDISVVILLESLVQIDNVVLYSISINVSNLGRCNDSTVGVDANSVSSNEVGKIGNKDLSVSNLDLLEDFGRDGDCLEGDAVGLVVLS